MIRIKFMNARQLLLITIFLFLNSCQLPANEANLSHKAFQRLGQTIHLMIDRFAEAGAYVSKGNLNVKVGPPVFSKDFRKMQMRITGYQKLPISALKHRAIRFFFAETPLPPRKECVGFLKVFPPANHETLAATSIINLPYRLDLEVNLQQCVFIAAKAGINFALNETKLLEDQKLLLPLQKINNAEFRKLLEKFFPAMCRFTLNKGIDKTLDTALSIGSGKPQSLLLSVGLDDFFSFAALAAIHGGKHVAAQQLKNLAAGSAGVALSAMVVPIPVVGEMAIGAFLVSLAIKNAPGVIDWSIQEFQRGIFRDRLGKATMYLMGKYPPGRFQVEWLQKQVGKEAEKDEFATLHKILFFLRLQPTSVRSPWKKVLASFAKPVAAKVSVGDSFKAERYLSVIRFLETN